MGIRLAHARPARIVRRRAADADAGAGALWARAAFRTRDLVTCLALGGAAGFAAHLIALHALSYLFPIPAAGWLLAGVEVLLLLACGRGALQAGSFETAAARAELRGAAPWLLVLAGWCFLSVLLTGTTDQLNHANIAGVMLADGLPMRHPYDPGQVFMYHYGTDLLGAWLGASAGLPPVWMVTFWTACSGVWTLLLVVEILRAAAAREGRAASSAELVFGALLFAFAGSFAWIDWLSGVKDFTDLARLGFNDSFAGSIVVQSLGGGWLAFSGILAAVLRWPEPAARGRWSLATPALPLGLLLAVSILAGPHAGILAGLALLAVTAATLATGRGPRPLGDWILAGALGVGLAAVQGGTLSGVLLGFSGSGQVALRWNGALLPVFPAWHQRVGPELPGYFAYGWRELGLGGWLAPLWWAWALAPGLRAPAAARWLVLATAPGLALALWFHLPLDSIGLARFAQLHFSAVMLAAGLLLAKLWTAEHPATRSLRRAACVLAACLLCMQSVRAAAQALLAPDPAHPLRLPAGQLEALEAVRRSGEPAPVLAYGRDSAPVAPAVLGRPIRSVNPELNDWGVRSASWARALNTPSPRNLWRLGAGWVVASPEQLPHAVPLLEGLPDFEARGVYGAPPAFRLYRFRETSAWDEHGLARANRLRRREATRAAAGARLLPRDDALALLDGDPDTAALLEARDLAGGLALELKPDARGLAPEINVVWLLAGRGLDPERFRLLKELDLELQVQRLDGGQPSYAWERPAEGECFPLRRPERPAAWGLRFADRRVSALRVSFPVGAAALPLAELYAGQAALEGPRPAE
ncbi:MAG: hypothetical protein M5U26_29690 [Planctomycetota bacterium]|nr:hypothetical protein [Planctomycetota bacterium]